MRRLTSSLGHVLKLLLILICGGHQLVEAAVVSVDITRRVFLERFAAGDYEEIIGTAHFEIDPANLHNVVIADVELAPRNGDGLVEFSADVVIWKPVDMLKSNDVTLIDIPNRGAPVANSFNRPAANQPFGDGFMMDAGYTIVWIGWEYDIPDDASINIDVPEVRALDNIAIAGLGFAAVRDLASWIKNSPEAIFHTDDVLGFGLSQSGRFLRNYLYLGFNVDEEGRQVFDGILAHIAGASRIDLNSRGAEPVSQGQYDATAFPFTDAAYKDPVSGAEEGLLDNPRARAAQPKIFYTNTAVEYWGGGRVAALTHLLPDGSADIPEPDNIRRYFLASAQHGPAPFPPGEITNGQLPGNPLDYWWTMRALLTALKEWVVDDREPPASKHPLLANASLVTTVQVGFPELAGVHVLDGIDAGVRAANKQLVNNGGEGAPLPLLVPQVDSDGNDVAGIRHPELAVPLATYTGWNFTHPERGNADTLFPLLGSYIPFATTAARREQNHDPRLAISERYRDKVDFLRQVRAAGEALVAQRYLLQQDIEPIVSRAESHWDLLMNQQ